MSKIFIAILMGIHGLLHFIGFNKAVELADMRQLSIPISGFSGILWLATALLFILAAILFFLKKEYWWALAGTAILFSQFVIINSWKEAHWGTIVNLLLVIPVIIGYSNWRFQKNYQQEAENILARAGGMDKTIVTKEMLLGFPLPVQQWLENANVIGKPMIDTVHLTQKGEMRTKLSSKWISFEAEQYYSIAPPAFIWKTTIKPSSWSFMNGRDKYENGKGNMLIKLLGILPVANSKGMEADQGSMLRYLSEIIWFPTAAISPYIKWEAIDAGAAKATMTCGGISASGIFHFTPNGDPSYFEAMRYYDRGKQKATLEKWVPVNVPGAMKQVNGIRIPYKGEVTWELNDGYFTWLKLEVQKVQYNEINA